MQGHRVSMGKITGFLEIERHERKYEPVAERLKSFKEFVIPLSEKDTRDQAARCMHLTYAPRRPAENVVNGVKTIMVNDPLRIGGRASHRGIERAKGDARVQNPSPGIRNGQTETADDQIIRLR